MDWKWAVEEERAALGRIVALLCALAALAERAAGRSPVVRSLVLWFLRHAEAVARDFVEGGAPAPSASMPVIAGDTGPAEALRLAVSLRALARQLDSQASMLAAQCRQDVGEYDRSPAGRIDTMREALASLSRVAEFALGAPPPARAPDTS